MTDMRQSAFALGPDLVPFTDCGQGEPVVLLHGALGDRRTFEPVAARLGEQYRAIAPTQRYFGPQPSYAGAAPFGTGQQAEDLLAMFDALGLARVHVVAWSFSAHSALAAALAAPQRFASLTLYETGFPTYIHDEAALAMIRSAGEAAFGPVYGASARGDLIQATRLLIDASAGQEGYFNLQSGRCRQIHLDNAHTIPLLFSQTPPVPIRKDDLRGLALPTTIGWGDGTSPAYELPSREAAGLIPGATGIMIEGAGHLWPEANPEAFAAFVQAALQRAGAG